MIEPHHHDGKISEWIRHGGYPALFGLLLLCGVGLPLPEDIPLLTAGILIQRGDFNLGIAAICAWCGIIGGDCILYSLGRKFGEDVTKIPILGAHLNRRKMQQVERWFDRWGIWVVAVGRLFAGVRGAMVVVAGTSKFKFWKFVLADGLAAVVSGGAFLFLGYKFGQNRERLHEIVHQIKGGMLIGFGVLLIAVGLYYLAYRRRMRDQARRGFNVIQTVEPDHP